jgi:toxin ParE1/3/4
MIRRLEVRYRESARTDLDQIFWYIAAAASPKIALAYVQRIEARCLKIGDAPRSGRPRDDLYPGLRTIPFEGTAIICYTVRNQQVWIDNIFRRGRDFEAVMRDASPDDDEA